MKTLHAITAVAVLAGAAATGVLGAVGADAPARPPGVSANDWAPISDTMGVVLVDHLTGAMDAPIVAPQSQGAASARPMAGAAGGAALMPPVTGYIMVKRGSLWQRLIVIDPVKGPGSAG